MTKKELKAKALEYCKPGGVVYSTPDGCIFIQKSFAVSHSVKTMQEITEYKQPTKKVKNGTK
jgi:hypothetical protein|tara:strand:+ start:734 stop:919 length:186 start_codon:yes stop_codon:yes gene_type:complete